MSHLAKLADMKSSLDLPSIARRLCNFSVASGLAGAMSGLKTSSSKENKTLIHPNPNV